MPHVDEGNEGILSDGAGLFSPEHYSLGKIFWMPHQTGLKRAIAIERLRENMLVSLYTILITGTFMAFWILIAMLLPYILSITTHQLRNDKAFRSACAWEVTEPFQAAVIMGRFCWHKILEIYNRLTNRNRVQGCNHIIHTGSRKDCRDRPLDISHSPNSPVHHGLVSDLCSGILVLLLALGVVVGGFVAGIYLPEKLVIGHLAPVNPSRVFLWNYLKDPLQPAIRKHYIRIGIIESERISKTSGALAAEAVELENRVHVTSKRVGAPPQAHKGEEIYNILYNYTITGVDLGLQRMTGLQLAFKGECNFEYSWYEGTELIDNTLFDRYTLWGNNTAWSSRYYVDLNSSCSSEDPLYDGYLRRAHLPGSAYKPGGSYLLSPFAQGKPSLFPNKDPWYFTGSNLETTSLYPEDTYPDPLKCSSMMYDNRLVQYPTLVAEYRVQPGRPILHCFEHLDIMYQHGPPLKLPLLSLLNRDKLTEEYERWADALQKELPKDVNPPRALTLILWMNLAMWVPVPSAIDFNGQAGWKNFIIDGESATALSDMKRLISTAYLATRNMYRDTALAFTSPRMPTEATKNFTLGLNLLVNSTTGDPIEGAGDFVIPSDDVTTLRLETLVAIPAVLVFTWLVVVGLWFFNRDRDMGICGFCGHRTEDESKPGNEEGKGARVVSEPAAADGDIVIVPVSGQRNYLRGL